MVKKIKLLGFACLSLLSTKMLTASEMPFTVIAPVTDTTPVIAVINQVGAFASEENALAAQKVIEAIVNWSRNPASGLLAYALSQSKNATYTVWASEEVLMAFAISEPHRNFVKEFGESSEFKIAIVRGKSYRELPKTIEDALTLMVSRYSK